MMDVASFHFTLALFDCLHHHVLKPHLSQDGQTDIGACVRYNVLIGCSIHPKRLVTAVCSSSVSYAAGDPQTGLRPRCEYRQQQQTAGASSHDGNTVLLLLVQQEPHQQQQQQQSTTDTTRRNNASLLVS